MMETKNDKVVQGLEVFRQYLAGQEEKFVIVGGTAIQLVRGQYLEDGSNAFSGEPRVTKDIDILVVIDKLDQDFINAIQKLIVDGEYQCEKKKETNYYYRFVQKNNLSFPGKIELLTRDPFPENDKFKYASLTGGFKGSLSAIVLDSEYYAFAKDHTEKINGLYSLPEIGLIVLKVSASLNRLEEYQKKSEQAKDRDYFYLDYQKHLQDVFLLVGELKPEVKADVSEKIKNRLTEFIEKHNPSHYQWPKILSFVHNETGDPADYIARYKEVFDIA